MKLRNRSRHRLPVAVFAFQREAGRLVAADRLLAGGRPAAAGRFDGIREPLLLGRRRRRRVRAAEERNIAHQFRGLPQNFEVAAAALAQLA